MSEASRRGADGEPTPADGDGPVVASAEEGASGARRHACAASTTARRARARRQLGEAGIGDAARIIERRAGAGQLRIGVPRLEIVARDDDDPPPR